MKDTFLKNNGYLYSSFNNKTDIIDKIKEITLSASTNRRTPDIISYIIERQIKDIVNCLRRVM